MFCASARAATVHVARLTRASGERAEARVVAVYGFRDGRISFVDELTHAEDPAVAGLGSIRRHEL